MADKYTVRYLPAADSDLVSIIEWITNDSLRRAFNFVEKIETKIKALEIHTFLGVKPKDSKLNNYCYRVLIIDKYFVFYYVRRKTILIHRVIQGLRNLKDLI